MAMDRSGKDKQETTQLSLFGAQDQRLRNGSRIWTFPHQSPGGFDRDQQNEGVPGLASHHDHPLNAGAGLGPQSNENPKLECRMSNKEFRITKVNLSVRSFDVGHSIFDILRFAFERLRILHASFCLRISFSSFVLSLHPRHDAYAQSSSV